MPKTYSFPQENTYNIYIDSSSPIDRELMDELIKNLKFMEQNLIEGVGMPLGHNQNVKIFPNKTDDTILVNSITHNPLDFNRNLVF